MRKDIKHFTGSLNTIMKPDLLGDEDLHLCENYERKGTGNLDRRMDADEYTAVNTYLSGEGLVPIDFIKWYAPRKPKDCISAVIYIFFVKNGSDYELYLVFEKAGGFDSEQIDIGGVTYTEDCEFDFTLRGDSLIIADDKNRCQLVTIDADKNIISRVMGVSAPFSKPILEEIETAWDDSFFEEETGEGSVGECSYYRLSYTAVTKFGEESNGSPKSNSLDLAFKSKDDEGKISRWVKRIRASKVSLPDGMDDATKEIMKYFKFYLEEVGSVEGKDGATLKFAVQVEIFNKNGDNSYTISVNEFGDVISYENDIAPIAKKVTSVGDFVFFGDVKTKINLPFDFEYIFEMKLNNVNIQNYIDGIVRLRLFEDKIKDKDGVVVFNINDYVDVGGNLENRHHIRIFDHEVTTMIPINVIAFSSLSIIIGPIDSFTFVSRTGSHVGAFQGIAWDGTYFYTTAGIHTDQFHIYKYNSLWVLQDTVDCKNDLPGDATQINSIYCKDGYLYIGVNNWDGTPQKGWVVKYQASNLTYVSIQTVQNHYCEGCAFHDDHWWVVYCGSSGAIIVSKYNASWVHQADYNLSYSQTGNENIKGYQGIRWIGDYIYVNTHGDVTPQRLDVYHWNGSGFDEINRLMQPTPECSQGIEVDTENKIMWWAEREYGALDHRVVKTTYIFGSKFMDIEINFPGLKSSGVNFFYLCFNTYDGSWGGVGIPEGKYRSYEYGRFFDCMSGSSDKWTEQKAYHPDRIRSLKSLVCAPCDIMKKADEAINKCNSNADGEFMCSATKYVSNNLAYIYEDEKFPIGRKCVQINDDTKDGIRFGIIHANNEDSIVVYCYCSFKRSKLSQVGSGINSIFGNSEISSSKLAGWILGIWTDGTSLTIRFNYGDSGAALEWGSSTMIREMDFDAFPSTFTGFIGLSINFEERKVYLLMKEANGMIIVQDEKGFNILGDYKKTIGMNVEFGTYHALGGGLYFLTIDEMYYAQKQYEINTYINDPGCMMNISRFQPTFKVGALGYNYSEDKAGRRISTDGLGHHCATSSTNFNFSYYYEGNHKRTYFCWQQKLGPICKNEAMVQYYDHETGLYSEAVGTGKLPYADVQDGHSSPSIIVADNGKIIVVYEKLYGTAAYGEHNSPILVKISDEAETLGWTEPGGGWLEVGALECYPKLFKTSNGNIFIIARNSLGANQRYNVKIWKSTDNGESWDSGYVIANLDGGDNSWAYNIRLVNSDSKGLHICIQRRVPTGGDGYPDSYYLWSEDGITWYDVDQNFSKNIVSSGAITRAELDSGSNHFRVGHSATGSDHRFLYCGIISESGNPYLIQFDGTTTVPEITGWYLRYWNSGTSSWSKISISCGFTLPGAWLINDREGIWAIKSYSETKFDIYTNMGYNEDRIVQQWQTTDKGSNWTLIRQWGTSKTVRWLQMAINEPDFDYFFLYGAYYGSATESDLYCITLSDLIHNNNLSYGIAKKIEFKHFPYRQKWTDLKGINCPDLYFRDYPFEISDMIPAPSFLKYEYLNTLVIFSYSSIYRFVLKGNADEWSTRSDNLIPENERIGLYIRGTLERKKECLRWRSLAGIMQWDSNALINITEDVINIPSKDSLTSVELPKISQYWVHDNEDLKVVGTLTFDSATKRITKTGQGSGGDYWETKGIRVKDRVFILGTSLNEGPKTVTEVHDVYFVVSESLTTEEISCTLFKTKSYVFQENFKEFTTLSGLDIKKSAILYGGENVDDVNLFLNSYGKIEKYPGSQFTDVFSEMDTKKFQMFKQRLSKLMLHFEGSDLEITARVFNIRFGSPYYKDYVIPNSDITSILSGEWKGIDGGYKGNHLQFIIRHADKIKDMSFEVTEPSP